jgi:hypothetical protein
VSVDETRYHQAPCGVDDTRSTVGAGDLRAGAERKNRVAAERQCAVGQNGAALIHGDDDAAEHKNVGRDAIGTGVIWVTH